MADVASKQQTTALFLSTTVTRKSRHPELTKQMGNQCCARKHSVQFFVQFFFTQFNLECMGPFTLSDVDFFLLFSRHSSLCSQKLFPFYWKYILKLFMSLDVILHY